MTFILESLWLILPAGLANIAPVIVARYTWLKQLNLPLDGGLTWRGKRLLGPNKTVRGLVSAVCAGAIAGVGQYGIEELSPFFAELSLTSFHTTGTYMLFGAWLGVAAIIGDAVKSFFKRQRGVVSGASWIPFDQIDFSVAALIFAAPFANVTIVQSIITIIIVGGATYLTSYCGVALGIKKSL